MAFAYLSPREKARRLLADDFAALYRGAKTLADVGDRARRLAETAETPELSATLLAGAIRLFERAGEEVRAGEARKRLEDCRHPFRVSGDAATLKLGEFGEIDFVRCPTGTVELVLQWPKVRTRTVTVSRPYWIAKYPLTRRQAAFFSPLDSQKGATPEERTDDYACVNRAMAEGLTAHFTRYFARALPTNVVIRLPFWCRWKAASGDFGEDWCPIRLVIGQKVN